MTYYDDTLCVTYDELLDGNPEATDEMERPIMTRTLIDYYRNKGQIRIVRRGYRGQTALIDFHTLPEAYQKKVTAKYGDPIAKATRSNLRDSITRDMRAEAFYQDYTPDGHTHLRPEVQEAYVMNASALNGLIDLMSRRVAFINARGGNSRRVWKELADELALIQDSIGCKLPKNSTALKRVLDKYKAEGYAGLISKKHGNANARKNKSMEQDALIVELLGDGRNLNDETAARLYNMVASKMGWPTITAETMRNYRQEHPECFPGRLGEKAFRNERMMQVTRKAPSAPMLYWTSDGWDAELFYKRVSRDNDGHQVTTYHHRPTVVMILDPFNLYIVGYAIGTHENPDLIRAAFRNAIEHIRDLMGDYYRPWQLQTDNYGKGALTGFYKGLTQYYTPATKGNAKAKVIEPFFRHFNDNYCRLAVNTSGYGVKSRKELQVSDDWIAKHKADFPDFEGCCRQLEGFIEMDRAMKRERYVEAFRALPESRRLAFPRKDWLATFGELAQPRKIQPRGVTLTLAGQTILYDCMDPEFRNYGHKTFFLRYDPSDLSQVLAVENDGTIREPREGRIRFVLTRKEEQPMALMDRTEGDAARLAEVQAFNKQLREDIIRKRKESAEVVNRLFEENEDLLRDTLTAHVITDSRGRHKDRRNELRGRLEELPPMPDQLPEDDRDDYVIDLGDSDFLNDF